MKVASLDTNVLLRLLLNDNAVQTAQIGSIVDDFDLLEVSDLAVAEVAFVLEKVYFLERSSICEAFELLMANQSLNLNRTLLRRVLPLYREHASLSFVDCCLPYYAELNRALPLMTFDVKLAKKLPKQVKLIAKD